MATTRCYLEYVLDLLSEVDGLSTRKMMGEYLLYSEGTLFGGIYDDRLLVKETPASSAVLCATAAPYEGAKPMRLVDSENGEMLSGLIRAVCEDLRHGATREGPAMMAFDYKKEYKALYLPPKKPGIVDVPAMQFIAVRGYGDPNEEGGAYKDALEMLYGVAYAIKMSKKGARQMEGYFDFVVPPLEGFWWQDDADGVDYARKENFNWISVIRMPEFVTQEDFDWAVAEATAKKKRDFSKVEFLAIEEGLCVQCLHVGPYDDEPVTVEAMHDFAREAGYVEDFSDMRRHHEIYLNDARRTAPEKLKTVIRHPVRRM